VVHRRAREHQPVEQGYREAHLRPGGKRPHGATGARSVEAHAVADPRVERWNDKRLSLHGEAEMNRRLRAVGFLAQFTVDFFLEYNDRILQEAGGVNAFYVAPMQSSNNVGGNPRAGYMQMMYDIKAGEALIIEVDVPQARYWSAHLMDMWWQTTDYAYHHSSLNGHQARVDADGKVRIVLSIEDPGVPNWLDPVDNSHGIVQWRWYLTDRHPTPVVRSVPLAELGRHLPERTPSVTLAERQLDVQARTAFVRRNYRL